ncbi:hypothetical protein IDJ77_12130 [Mucilaginibacter sp. ZT4R22]|uniref:Photosynthesis system II assembly factor Ycf48/Hcf136-like domain-containing protein n=1 Tax=Mucilaginibacter pankratovii TaxID=2772110 RepID=A0ABR7WQF1_9SPHI|nr:hypothetical protein [Mucilaginibacter pankratovii]MBD1364558.1 hypothetical protein [Mucilaginibacter pankratovii]
MSLRLFLFFTLINILFSSCQQNERNGKLSKKNNNPSKSISSESDNHYIIDILDMSDSSIVILKDKGFIISNNLGRTWIKSNLKVSWQQITVDQTHTLWGITSITKQGNRQLMIGSSIDSGISWKITFLNSIFSGGERIISKTKQPLELLTEDYKVYRLVGEDLNTDWKYIKKIPESLDQLKYDINPFQINDSDDSNLMLIKKNITGADTLLHLEGLHNIENAILSRDTIYFAGSGTMVDNVYTDAYFSFVDVKNKHYKKISLPGRYASIKLGIDNRVWVYTGEHVFLKKPDGLQKIY